MLELHVAKKFTKYLGSFCHRRKVARLRDLASYLAIWAGYNIDIDIYYNIDIAGYPAIRAGGRREGRRAPPGGIKIPPAPGGWVV